jgi:twitching motility protein PilU
MIGTPLVADLIFRGEIVKIKDVMSRSNRLGMKTFDQALFELYESGQISYEEGLRNADSKNELRLRIKLESKREDRLQAETSTTLRIVDESNDGQVY